MKLLIGLGNPGAEHAGNRHNIGFMALDAIAGAHGFGPWRNKFQGQLCEGLLGAEKCLLLKPSTFMNESGRAANEAVRFYKLDLDDVIILHDELDLAPGKVRVKTGGGVAGHNGLRSLTSHIGNDYVRVRIGIGHPGDKSKVHSHVLKDFSKSEMTSVEPQLAAIANAAAHLVEDEHASFMNKVALGSGNDKKSRPLPKKPARKTASVSNRAEPAQSAPADGPFSRLRAFFGTNNDNKK